MYFWVKFTIIANSKDGARAVVGAEENEATFAEIDGMDHIEVLPFQRVNLADICMGKCPRMMAQEEIDGNLFCDPTRHRGGMQQRGPAKGKEEKYY